MTLFLDVTQLWWSWIGPMSVQVTVLGLLIYGIDRLSTRWLWPEHRTALWLLCLLKLVVPPDVHSPASVASVFSVPGQDQPPDVSATLVAIAFFLWAGGVMLIGFIGAVRYRREVGRRMDGASAELPDTLRPEVAECARRLGLRRPPFVVVSPSASGPCVLGVRRPTVVLPEYLLHSTSGEERTHVLLHELGHIKHRDPWLGAFGLVLSTLYWFHPVVWLAQRRLGAAREESCDALVVRRTHSPAAYRSTLLQLASRIHRVPRHGLAFVGGQSILTRRLEGLERWNPRFARARHLAAGILFLGLVSCVAPLGRPVPYPDPAGCLTLRYQVLAELSKQNNETPPGPAPRDEERNSAP